MWPECEADRSSPSGIAARNAWILLFSSQLLELCHSFELFISRPNIKIMEACYILTDVGVDGQDLFQSI
jgi:hypothetical protein